MVTSTVTSTNHTAGQGAVRELLTLIGRGLLAMLGLFVCLSLSSSLFGLRGDANAASALPGLFGMLVMFTVALSYPVVRSRRSGWWLVAFLFLAMAGLNPLLLQVETALFLVLLVPIVPPEAMPSLIASPLFVAAVFSPLVVLVFGRLVARPADEAPTAPSGWSVAGWAWRLAAIGLIYTVVYFTFGLLVAVPLAGPAFSEYYANLKVPAWMPLVQVARGAVWALVMLPLMRSVGGRWWEPGLAIALLSSFLSASGLLVPNPFMPDQMRFAHFFELLSSNFVFGWAIFLVFRRR